MLNPVNIVYLGDSITCGQYVWRGWCWTSIVTERLIESNGVPVLGVNSGVNGETTRRGLERFSEVQQSGADILTIQYGMNDCNCWDTDRGLPRVSRAAYEANIIEMINRARHFGINKIILSSNPRTLKFNIMLNHRMYETCNAEYSGIIENIAKNLGVVFCDIRNALAVNKNTVFPDGLHLNVEGHRLYAGIIYPYLEKALGEILNEKRVYEPLG